MYTRLDLFIIWSCVVMLIICWGYFFHQKGGTRRLAAKIVRYVVTRKKRKSI